MSRLSALFSAVAGGTLRRAFFAAAVLLLAASPAPGGTFATTTAITPLAVSANTGEKPQSKVWTYDGRWWAVLPNSSGTYIWRLDGTAWTSVLQISTATDTHADVKAAGSVVHILLYAGTSSSLASVEYVPSTHTWQAWSARPALSPITLDAGVETATIDIDTHGRMWLASDASTDIRVRWSDSPYSSWSSPITLATGVTTDDISAVTAIPAAGMVGVLWSNQNSQRFGFRTHADGGDPATWNADEVPASQSALSVGAGMADDHLHMAVASDGTVYAAVKTSYDTPGYPKVALLVRRPAGTWDNLYEVDQSGTRGIILINEAKGELTLCYTLSEGQNDIVFKQSPLSPISFGTRQTLIAGGAYNETSSMKDNYGSSLVILATNVPGSTAAGVIATSVTADPALVADYRMDEGGGSTLVDSSGSGNNALIRGSAAWTTGVKGAAFTFNGSSTYGAAPNAASLNMTGGITLAGWFKCDKAAAATQRLIAKAMMNTNDGYELSLASTGKVFVRFNQKASADVYRVNSTTSYPLNGSAWMHAAATFDGSTIRLYINGTQEGSVAMAVPIGTNADSLYIGRQRDNANPYYFQGKEDGVVIYNRALTATEIQALASHAITASSGAGGSISPTGPVAVLHGATRQFTVTPDAGFHVDSLIADGVKTDSTTSYTFRNVIADHTIRAVFASAANQPPNAPAVVAPANGATGIGTSPTLRVAVSDPNSDAMAVTFYGKPSGGGSGPDFTIIEIPDAQNYTAGLNGGSNEILKAQTQWIVSQRAARNIAYVNQVGDLVNDGDTAPIQWYRADTAMGLLENPATTGLPEGIPYGVGVGNHEQTPIGDPNGTTTYFNQYFGAAHFAGKSYYGGHYGANNDNSFRFFNAGGMRFIVVSLEYAAAPSPGVLHWADSLLKAYPACRAIVSNHYPIGTGNPAPFTAAGSAIYDSLKDNPNFFLMLGGHVTEDGRRSDTFNGSTVHTLLADYQGRANGGNGWLRILEFSPANNEIRVKTYSPVLDQYETTPNSQFTLSYPMAPASFQPIGTDAGVPSGTEASTAWPGLAGLTSYDWYAVASDGRDSTTGPTWTFTTAAGERTITATAGLHGTIAPSGTVTVTQGSDASFTITPDPTYRIDSVLVDGAFIGAPATYTFTNVQADHAIEARFASVPSDPLVGHWAMDEGSGTVLFDSSAWHNDGSITGAPSWVPAIRGSGLAFNGTSQYAAVPDNASLRITGAITIAAWIRPQVYATQDLIKKAVNGSTDGYELALAAATGNPPMRPFVRFNQATSADAFRLSARAASVYPTDGTWMHLAATYDGATIRLYINGTLDTSKAAVFTIAANSNNLGIGAQSDGQRKFQGSMDDAFIYNRALDASEIEALARRSYTLTASAGPNGAIAPTGAVVVPGGSIQRFAALPDAGYMVDSLIVDGLKTDSTGGYTFAAVAADHTIRVTFKPATVHVTVQTAPAGLAFTADGVPFTAPHVFTWTTGAAHTIAADSIQPGAAGTQYAWQGWSDGGSRSHTVHAAADSAFTATFGTQFYLTVSSGGNGTAAPPSGWRTAGERVTIGATPNPGYHFVSWAGAGAGSVSGNANPDSVTMEGPITETASFAHDMATVILRTNPPGLSYSVDGVPHAAAETLHVETGSTFTVAAATPQAGPTGVQYVWAAWSDGGAISHVAAVTADIELVAGFTTQYFLTMIAGNGGRVSPANGWHDAGASVQITATPDAGYSFGGWNGNGNGSFTGPANPAGVAMNAPITETAGFAIVPVHVTIGTNPPGLTYQVDGATYTSTEVFTWDYRSPHFVEVPTPQGGGAGRQFVWTSWSDGGASGHGVGFIEDASITANFAPQYALTIAADAGGSAAALPAQAWYDSGAAVQITATAGAGHTFASWRGAGAGSYTGTDNPATVTMNGPVADTAGFSTNTYTLALTALHGSVAKLPDLASYPYGTAVQLTAKPDAGWHFVDWGDGLAGSRNPDTVVMLANRSVTANFAANQYPLTLGVAGHGTAAKSPDSPLYDYHTSVQLTATPDTGWEFTGWSGDASGAANPLTVSVDSAMNVTAHFTIRTFIISASASGNGAISPPGGVIVAYGASQLFTMTPDPENHLDSLIVDGAPAPVAGTYTFTGVTAGHTIRAAFAAGSFVEVRDTVRAGWNMLSVPAEVPDYSVRTCYPTARTQAFAYEGTYQIHTALTEGIGYWVGFGAPVPVTYAGYSRTRDTLDLVPGWNLIGTLSTPIAAAAAVPIPPGIIAGSFFGYDGKYAIVSTLAPGRGYWIKATGEGRLVLAAGSPAAPAAGVAADASAPAGLSSLTITDAAGNEQALSFGKTAPAGFFELPPIPPEGTFDARFADGTTVASLGGLASRSVAIRIATPAYPVTVAWRFAGSIESAMLTIGGKERRISGSGSVSIGETEASLTFPAPLLPKSYELAQNFPNPFNPVTAIRYALPEESRVTIAIYDLLGRETAVLVDAVQDERFRKVEWNGVDANGRSVPSGVYILRMEARSVHDAKASFSRVVKMMLMK